MIELNKRPEEKSSNPENCNNDNSSCKLCLNPIFFEPDKFITADFQIEVRNLCPGSRIAIVVEVRRSIPGGCYQTLATVHDIFDVPNCNHRNKPCKCKTVTITFRDIILDLHPAGTRNDDPCHNLRPEDLIVTVVKSNYISRNDSSCNM